MLFEGRFHAMKICTDAYFHLCLVLYRSFFFFLRVFGIFTAGRVDIRSDF